MIGSTSCSIDVALLLVDALEELVLVLLRRLNLAVLADGLLELAINLKLGKCNFLVSTVSNVENAAVIFIGIASPH